MAIEIREVVVKATVHKSLDGQDKYVTKDDLHKLHERLSDKILKKVKNMLEEGRSSR